MSKKIRPPVKIHGGKAYLARRIIALFPVHYERMTYVEPYGGAASVLLNKNPSAVEIYNDVNRQLVCLFTVLTSQPDEFRKMLTVVPYSKLLFEAARDLPEVENPVARAVRYYIQMRQSRGGLGATWANSNRSRGGMAGDVNAWLTSIDENLPLVIERLREVAIENVPALELIDKYMAPDAPDTLFYLDPPYYPDTRTHKTTYGPHEMTHEDHDLLLTTLGVCKEKFILSGYANPLYNEAAKRAGWHRTDIDMPNHSGQGASKQRRTESLWRNY